MSFPTGQRLGIYEILAPIGQGGMGEVYRARDTKLGRDVAIKILPELVDGNAERVARFRREAQLLASLNHPNIGGIYGLEEFESTHFLVLELIDGETVADRLRRDGRVPLPETLNIARQLLDALEAAHERGIIHRDLKPANIMLTEGGQVKVLDFGLAKALDIESNSNISNSPTLTMAATREGVILGTAAYMSPEQAKGRGADKRSDIWAIGCVLFEMLSGQRAFKGEDVSDTLAMVLRSDPDWSLLPPETPAHVTTVVRRCLQRDRNLRLRDVSIIRFLLDEPLEAAAAARQRGGSSSPWRAIALLSMVLTVLMAVLLLRGALSGGTSHAPVPSLHFEVPLPPKASLTRATTDPLQAAVTPPLALSPDGTQLAFIVDDGEQRRIWIRPLSASGAHELAGTDGAAGLFWSPDGAYVAFFADRALKKIPAAGGSPQKLCDVPDHRGGSWGSKGDLIFGGSGEPIKRVSQSGGVSSAVTKLEQGELLHGRPHFLPDGEHFLFKSGSSDALFVGALTSTERKKVLDRTETSNVVYANGRLLYVLGAALMAQPFNLNTLTVEGEPVRVADRVRGVGNPPVALFSVSQTGLLAFQGGAIVETQLKWIDRKGTEEPIGEPGPYQGGVELSPDGTRATVGRTDPTGPMRDLWVFDLVRRFPTRLTSDPADEYQGVWSPTGDRIVYSSREAGKQFRLFSWSLVDGRSTMLLSNGSNNFPNSWSPDGKLIFFTMGERGSGFYNVAAVPAAGGEPIPIVASSFNEREGRISPDGRWLAYDSNETGREQVYLTPFPKRELRIPVSVNGGADARWNPNGRELFFLANGRVMAAEIAPRGDVVTIGSITPLFELKTPAVRGGYAVGEGGRRFLVVGYKADPVEGPIEVITNWLPPQN